MVTLRLPKHCGDLAYFSPTYAVFVPLGGWRNLTYGQGSSCQQVCPGSARDRLTEHEHEAGSMEDPLRIVSLKRKNIPKLAVLAMGLTAAVVAVTIGTAPAQAYSSNPP